MTLRLHTVFLPVNFQMTSSNLAVCFLPSFFRMQPVAPSNKSASVSHKNEAATVPQWDHKSAITCITFLINNVEELFEVNDVVLFKYIYIHYNLSEYVPCICSFV